MTHGAIELAFAETSNGPWIVLYGPMDADFVSLQRCFDELRHKTGEFDLRELVAVTPLGSLELFVSCLPQGSGICRSPQRPVRFDWSEPAHAWEDHASRIALLVMSDSPCHQRLSGGDATVIVSKGEYTHRWFGDESPSEQEAL
jgi:hypothetical protein